MVNGYGPPSLCFVEAPGSRVRCLRDGASVPVTVAGTDGATDVELGTNHGCAIVAGGRVRCWGLANDQLGYSPDVLYDQRIEDAREVPGIQGATALALGFGHTCAVVGTGEVWCWGSNSQGQLGQPLSLTNTRIPQKVPRLRDATSLTSSTVNLCATRQSHALTCWGSARYSAPRPGESDWWLGARVIDERDLPATPDGAPGDGGPAREVGDDPQPASFTARTLLPLEQRLTGRPKRRWRLLSR